MAMFQRNVSIFDAVQVLRLLHRFTGLAAEDILPREVITQPNDHDLGEIDMIVKEIKDGLISIEIKGKWYRVENGRRKGGANTFQKRAELRLKAKPTQDITRGIAGQHHFISVREASEIIIDLHYLTGKAPQDIIPKEVLMHPENYTISEIRLVIVELKGDLIQIDFAGRYMEAKDGAAKGRQHGFGKRLEIQLEHHPDVLEGAA